MISRVSEEIFQEWRDHPVTQAVLAAVKREAEVVKNGVLIGYWGAMHLSPELQAHYTHRKGEAHAYERVSDMTYWQYVWFAGGKSDEQDEQMEQK